MATFWENSAKILAALSPLLAVLTTPLLQRWGLARKAKEIEVTEKRVQIFERLLTLDMSDETRNQLKIEVDDIAQNLIAERRIDRTAFEDVKRLPFWRRFLLVYPQPTIRASIYRGFFWVFLGVFVMIVLMIVLSILLLMGTGVPLSDLLIGGLFYLAIGLLFRVAAIRQLKQSQAARVLSSDPRSWQPTRVSPGEQSKPEQQSG